MNKIYSIEHIIQLSDMAKELVPALNDEEILQLALFFEKVLLRLDEEEAYLIEEQRTQK